MKITKVNATNHKVSVLDPFEDQPMFSEMIFLRVETDEDVTGEVPCAMSPVECELVNRKLGPLIVGENPLESEKIWDKMFRSSQRGVSALGLSIIDCALWDIKGKYLEQPVWRLLGGARQKIPVYFTLGSGIPLSRYSNDQFAEWAKGRVNEGWNALKFAIARGYRWEGYRSVRKTENQIVGKVRAVRDAVGDKVKIMVDSNTECSLTEAVRLAKLIEPFDITWYEEPVWENDPYLLAQIKLQTSIPIAAGQCIGYKWKFRDLITIGKIDIVQPDVQYIGGFTEAVKVTNLAQAFNLQIATHGAPLINSHLVAGLANGLITEFHFTAWNSQKALLKNTLEPENSWFTLSDRPGFGLEPDEDALEESLVE